MLRRLLFLFLFPHTIIHAQPSGTAYKSVITEAALPAKAEIVLNTKTPGEFNQLFSMMLKEGKGKIVGGEPEVMAWPGNYKNQAEATKLITQLKTNFRNTGWQYDSMQSDGGYDFFNLYKSGNPKRAIVGFFYRTHNRVYCALMEIFTTDSLKPVPATNTTPPGSPQSNASPKLIKVEKSARSVNIMGNEMPSIPSFPSLQPKAGKVRGYVKDCSGKPLAGAIVGVRSSYFAGYYSGGQGKTDASGYYEITPPEGMAEFYCAAYPVTWGKGVAALSLHPADGKTESFITKEGTVKNFVLLPYGVTSPENLQQNPHLPSAFYGGAVHLSWYAVEDNDDNAPPFGVKEGSTLEITLTPEGNLLDGSKGQVFTIRKTAGLSGAFSIHNIPAGAYRISIQANRRAVKIKDNTPSGQPFGMNPAEATGTGAILFIPDQANASMVAPQYGAWKWIDLRIEQL